MVVALVTCTVFVDLVGGDESDVQQETRRIWADLRQQNVESVEPIRERNVPEGAKAMDPALLSALVVAVAPTMLSQLLEFLHAWAMRREGRVVKVKLQTGDGRVVEGEFPATMSQEDARQWIAVVAKSLPKAK